MTLDKIVRNFLIKENMSLHYYLQALAFAIECATDLSFSLTKAVSWQLLTVDSNGEAPLPAGFMKEVRVGMVQGPMVIPMMSDPSVHKLDGVKFDGQEESRVTYRIAKDYSQMPIFTYTVQVEKNIIVVNVPFINSVRPQVYFEFLAEENYSADTNVIAMAEETIYRYIVWNFSQVDYRRNLTSLGDQDRKKASYYNSRQQLAHRVIGLDIDQVKQLGRTASVFTARI